MKLLVIIGILTIFSLVIFPGYKVFVSDHKLYIPAIYQALNPTLFQNDLLLSFNQTEYTLFDELIIFLMDILNTNIFYVLFFLSVIIRFIYFYSIYKISFYFTDDKKFSTFSILLLISGFWVYGTASSTLDINLVPRLISLAFNLLFLVCFFNKKYFLSTLPLGIGLLIHPITSLPFIIFFYLNLFFFYSNKGFLNSRSLFLGTIPFLFLIFLLLNIKTEGLGFFTFIDPIWENIIRLRDPYIFITSWSYIDFFHLIASICFFLISYLELRGILKDTTKRKLEYYYLLFLIPLFLFVFSFITVDILKLHFFVQLQASRSLFLWKIFITLLFSYFAYNYIKNHPKDSLFNFSLIGILLSFIFKEFFIFLFIPMFLFLWVKRKYNLFRLAKIKTFNRDQVSIVIFGICTVGLVTIFLIKDRVYLLFYLFAILALSLLASLTVRWKRDLVFGYKAIHAFLILFIIITIIFVPRFSIHPSYFGDKELMEVCNWIKNNTNEQDVFITEPFSKVSGPLRLTCYRNVFTSSKDGAQVVFKRDYAIEWKKRMDYVHELKENHSLLSEILKEYDIDYVISENKLNISYPIVFTNTKYFIYDIGG